MKKIVAAMLSLGLLTSSYSVAMAANPEVYYNGQKLSMQQPAVIQEGRTLFALRDMAEQMDVDVQWDNATRLATIINKEKVITLQPDIRRILINGEEQKIDVGPQIIENHIYLPVRYLFELLGGDVFYRDYEDGRSIVSVNSKDSYINYVITTGRLTKAVRDVKSNSTNNPVVMTHDGNILELIPNNGGVVLHRTTQTLSRTEKRTEDTVSHTQITDIIEENGQYYAVLEDNKALYYVGNGYRPSGSPILKNIYTPQGQFAFYGSQVPLTTLALENTDGFISIKANGYLLDISSSGKTIRDHSYAFTNDEDYGFLTDGQLLVISNVPTKGFQVLFCDVISETIRMGKLFTKDNNYYVIGADTIANGKQEIFVASYNKQGQNINPYTTVSNLSSTENYYYLNIADSVQIGDKAYLLLQTNHSRYLGCYDLVKHTFTSEKLTQPFERFVQAKGSWQLYYCDEEYYYFLQVQ